VSVSDTVTTLSATTLSTGKMSEGQHYFVSEVDAVSWVLAGAMQSATCTMQPVDHHHVIRANRPQLSKQAGVCSDCPIVDDVGIVSDCAQSDSSDAGCETGRRISTELNVPINGICLV